MLAFIFSNIKHYREDLPGKVEEILPRPVLFHSNFNDHVGGFY